MIFFFLFLEVGVKMRKIGEFIVFFFVYFCIYEYVRSIYMMIICYVYYIQNNIGKRIRVFDKSYCNVGKFLFNFKIFLGLLFEFVWIVVSCKFGVFIIEGII